MSEAVNYPPISESIIAFNSLRFQMKSNKGVRHGVDSSQLQDHYMSPSATRRVVMIELAVLPDVERTMHCGVLSSIIRTVVPVP